MVWHAAQLRVNSVPPASRSASLVLTTGTCTPSPGVRDWTQAAISSVSSRLNRGGLRVAWMLELARGMRPVDTQKSIVPAPRPCRLGPRVVPRASAPWHVEQLAANRAWPGASKALGRDT